MGFVFVFVAIIAAIVIWWLSRQRLFAKPWLEEGLAGEFPGTGASQLPAAKLGLGVFLAVVGSLFALSLSAYVMRMENADWRPLPAPTVLWFNTGLLILSSVALQWAQVNARRGDLEGVQTGLLAAGALALAFLAGCKSLARARRREAAHERRTLRDLLALSASDLVDSVRPGPAGSRRVARKFHRTLHIGDPRHKIGCEAMAETAMANTGQSPKLLPGMEELDGQQASPTAPQPTQ